MALKPDREYNEVIDITNFWVAAQTSAEKGGVASQTGSSTGVGIDDTSITVAYLASPSTASIAKGILLNTVAAAMSTTRDFINYENGEIRPGTKCALVKKGFVVTDMIITTDTPTAGQAAYLAASGLIGSGTTTGPQVGRFETAKDAAGFARISIDIT